MQQDVLSRLLSDKSQAEADDAHFDAMGTKSSMWRLGAKAARTKAGGFMLPAAAIGAAAGGLTAKKKEDIPAGVGRGAMLGVGAGGGVDLGMQVGNLAGSAVSPRVAALLSLLGAGAGGIGGCPATIKIHP